MDCGPACLKMLTQYFGRNFSIQYLERICNLNRSGVTLLDISEAAEKLGLKTVGVRITTDQLKDVSFPCILHWRENHFVVLFKTPHNRYFIADPTVGILKLNAEAFNSNWINNASDNRGHALVVEPTNRFYSQSIDEQSSLDWRTILNHLKSYKKLLVQLILALTIGAIIQLILPFLTQAIVDIGIDTENLNFINMLLIAQLVFFIANTGVDFIRSWILLHISTRINISIVTELLIKLSKLPISFYDTRTPGDVLQRVDDERRIESFLTGSALNIAFSAINIVVFSVILSIYNLNIFGVFIASSLIYTFWILRFLEKRKNLDYLKFGYLSKNQDTLIEFINGIKDIKLHNAEKRKRWKWEHIQARLFDFNIKSLTVDQHQQAGAMLINQCRNILITYISARAVLFGELTLGSMLAITFIIGMLNTPIEQFIVFIKAFQSAKISLERLNEIYQEKEEQDDEDSARVGDATNDDIFVDRLTFQYPGAGNKPVFKDLTCTLPGGKTTAIVGMSGSGKTTLLKLLLRFYEPENGTILVGNVPLKNLNHESWRENCSAVLQDGYIFSDTVINNITMSEECTEERLANAIKIANVGDIVESLPNGLKSRIGQGAKNLSQGQIQRLLIARAVYRDAKYLFLDEATNALDSNNEKAIVENLKVFLKGRTVVVVAHRLSSVKNAENIIVLDKGIIVEQGTHPDLVSKRGYYFKLIENQLELGY